jgi:hypothetical protein
VIRSNSQIAGSSTSAPKIQGVTKPITPMPLRSAGRSTA